MFLKYSTNKLHNVTYLMQMWHENNIAANNFEF